MTSLIGFLFAASVGCLGWFTWKAWRRDPKLRVSTVLLSIGTTAVVFAAGFLSPRSEYRVERDHGLLTGPLELSLGPTYKPVWTFVALGVTVICAGIVAVSTNKAQRHAVLTRGAVLLATLTTVAALVVAQNVQWAEPRVTTGKPTACPTWPRAGCM
jgi:hypothetical protein